MLSRKRRKRGAKVSATYANRAFSEPIPKYEIPNNGIGPDVAYQLIHDEMNLDGNPFLNLASFVTTWMEPQAEKLIMETINKNLVDQEEYPQTGVIQERVVNMLAKLFNAPEKNDYVGTSTIGSSEAIMLGLLAHKWSWRKRREKEGKDTTKPNLVVGADVHVVWEKFAKYFDVELRLVPMEHGRYTMDVEMTKELIDENTICVGAVLGTTFTGQIDPIKEINEMLVDLKSAKGLDIPIHVDAASGGFIVPFLYPNMEWDFRLNQVKSINVSGHKYGLVYPGVGWLIFKDKEFLPEDLIFYVNYLGSEEATYTLNFSRNSAMVIAQYYNMLRLGKSGYKAIMKTCMENAKYVAKEIRKMSVFKLTHEDLKLPVVTFYSIDNEISVYEVSRKLRERDWIVPAYNLPKNAEDMHILRVVVKENFSRDMADMLIGDLKRAVDTIKGECIVRAPQKKKSSQIHNKIC
ncbi:glutamate decarboxylase [Hippea alviniae]|uniref:glutamate decarboxylase n=1 Tax=Hippea alviniae TaxID=1279027 RepID=UPI0003B70405|nr:glutamate decarboxylase [Hippea alviniae]